MGERGRGGVAAEVREGSTALDGAVGGERLFIDVGVAAMLGSTIKKKLGAHAADWLAQKFDNIFFTLERMACSLNRR